MKYLKLYEEFKYEEELIEPEVQTEISDKTSDDVFKDDFFNDEEESNGEAYQDKNGVYHITNWTVY